MTDRDRSALVDADGSEATGSSDPALPPMRRLLGLALLGAVAFAAGLELTELAGEYAVDVDFKPFFVPYLLIALVRFRVSALALATGAAVGEGALDVLEGYELEDPVGFLGYVVGFMLFAWYLRRADGSGDARALTAAALLGAFVQAAFEGAAFFAFDGGATPAEVLVSVAGNTVTHGLLLGAVPLVALYGPLRERVGTLDAVGG